MMLSIISLLSHPPDVTLLWQLSFTTQKRPLVFMPIKMRNIFVRFYLQQEVLSKAYARCLVFQVDSAWIVTCFLGRAYFQGGKWLWQLLQPPAAKIEILLPCESEHSKDCIKNSKDFSEHIEIDELEPSVKICLGVILWVSLAGFDGYVWSGWDWLGFSVWGRAFFFWGAQLLRPGEKRDCRRKAIPEGAEPDHQSISGSFSVQQEALHTSCESFLDEQC